MRSIFTILIVLLFSISWATAQDLATEHTQLLNNVELIVNGERQLKSLLNEAQMIENQIAELKSVATLQDTWVNIDQQRSELVSLVSEGVSLSGQIQNQLISMKKEAQDILNSGSLSDQQKALGQGTMAIVQITLDRVNESRRRYQSQENALQDLLAKNNSAVGQTQALQVLNQISAQNVTQMQATQEAIHNLAALELTRITEEHEEKKIETQRIDQIIHPVDKGTSSFDFGT